MSLRPPIFNRHILTLDIAASFKPSRNAATMGAYPFGDATLRNPITGIDCCARAFSGHVAVAPPITEMNSRRLMLPPPRKFAWCNS